MPDFEKKVMLFDLSKLHISYTKSAENILFSKFRTWCTSLYFLTGYIKFEQETSETLYNIYIHINDQHDEQSRFGDVRITAYM